MAAELSRAATICLKSQSTTRKIIKTQAKLLLHSRIRSSRSSDDQDRVYKQLGLFALKQKIEDAVLRAEMSAPTALELEESIRIKQEEIIRNSNLWDDPIKSNEVLVKLAGSVKAVDALKDLKYKAEEAKLISHLAAMEAINYQLFKQAYSASLDVSKLLDQYEMSKLLKGPYDREGACVIIKAESEGINNEGLIPALKERNVEHRFCLRHVYNNFKLKPEWHNKEMKDILDAAALSLTEKEFKMHMEKFDAKNAIAAKNYLMKLGPEHWSRHLWGTRAKSGMILNNPSECFNAYIMGERDKPIITMLEGLRKMCIKLAKDRANKLAGYKGPVCPQAQVKLEANKKQARFWKATDCGDKKFEIAKDRVQFPVNLSSMSCACYEWDLTGVPCEHAARAIFAINGIPEEYVTPYLYMTSYNGLWSVKLEPVNGENLWPASSQIRPLPPHLKRQPGRPKRVRIRDKDEAVNPYRAKNKKITIVCRKCKGPHHNSRTCRGEVKNKKDHTHEYYMGFTVPIQTWAEELVTMYIRWAEKLGYKARLVETQTSMNDSVSLATIEFEFECAYGYLCGERGLHHKINSQNGSYQHEVSSVSVDVIPLSLGTPFDLHISDDDLTISAASFIGEQKTLKQAVYVQHIPTGITLQSSGERSHFANKMKALNRLKAKLLVIAEKQMVDSVGSIKRDGIVDLWKEETRRYLSQPHRVVQDLKTGIHLPDLTSVLDGNIEPLIIAHINLIHAD